MGSLRRLLALLAVLAGGAETLSTQTTTTSGIVRDAATGQPVTVGWVGVVRRSTVDAADPERVWPDHLVPLDAEGRWSVALDPADPSWHELYVHTVSPLHDNQIHGGVAGVYGLPVKASFDAAGAVRLSGAASNVVDFDLEPNRSTHGVVMRDGVVLSTDVYRARRDVGDPVILVRTPYGKRVVKAFALYSIFGYTVVVQDTRGRFASGGVDQLFRTDGWAQLEDGFDTIEWAGTQPFSDGRVGMYGASALAMVQYYAAGAAPPSLVCCYAIGGGGDLYEWMFTGGVFRAGMIEQWLAEQGRSDFLAEIEAHPSRDPFWDDVDVETRLGDVAVPMMHVSGWFDVFQEDQLRTFATLQEQGGGGASGNQRLVMGPWTHQAFHGQLQGELLFPVEATARFDDAEDLTFFDRWLKGIDNGYDDGPAVRYYVMGDVDDLAAPGNEWRESDVWPPPSTPVLLALGGNGRLEEFGTSFVSPPLAAGPGGAAGPLVHRFGSPRRRSFLADPADPVPTLGGPNLRTAAGPFDQRALEARPDVITFTTDVLTEPVEVTGAVTARLFVASTAPDTDLMVKLLDVYPDGRSMLIQEGVLQARHRLGLDREDLLEPRRVHLLEVDLWSTSIVFNAGHRIRVSIASSNSPRFEVNPNTGEPFRGHTSVQTARNVVFCSQRWPSHVVLPVVP